MTRSNYQSFWPWFVFISGAAELTVAAEAGGFSTFSAAVVELDVAEWRSGG